ncbi:hypothetical protein PJL18_03844 [Paenarthrobacter nicotinovorans]|nr:hypothetical protein [Paenarthrobacter nicotinovorans]
MGCFFHLKAELETFGRRDQQGTQVNVPLATVDFIHVQGTFAQTEVTPRRGLTGLGILRLGTGFLDGAGGVRPLGLGLLAAPKKHWVFSLVVVCPQVNRNHVNPR